jgi:uncharacterized membrane protein YozB (DUF420 family)
LNLRRFTSLVVLFILFSPYFVVPVFANVPTVVQIIISQKGTDTIVTLNINHLNPSSTHYVDTIEIEINGVTQQIENLQPQNQETFSYEYNAGKINITTVKARAHCTLHGWSDWNSLLTTAFSTVTVTTTTSTSRPTGTVFTLATVNFLVQIILMTAIIIGAILAKKKKIKIHHKYMTALVLINIVPLITIMGPSLVSILGNPSRTFTLATTMSIIHGILGGVTEVFGLVLILKKLRKLKKWMRTMLTLWLTSLTLGIVLYIIFYIS